jgi:hypothetical protein
LKRLFFILTAIAVVLALALSTCFAQEEFLTFKKQGAFVSSDLTPPSEKSWVFFDLPLGKYRFDTSLQLEEMDQNKVSPTEHDKTLEQGVLSLQFSIKW